MTDILCENIEIIEGNLLKMHFHGLDYIAHSCNTHNVMGAGIARDIKHTYPEAYSADCHAMMEDKNVLGNFSFAWTDATQNKGVYNMYTQDKVGGKRAVNYEAFYVALENVADHIEWQSKHDDEEKVLGLPYGISCGLAGGSKRIINTMIHEILVDRSFKTYIVKYHE
jgi:O-acetyl-ADP-ribose deacetylase (regulator of RNase III)